MQEDLQIKGYRSPICNEENCPKEVLARSGKVYNPENCMYNPDKKEGGRCGHMDNKEFDWHNLEIDLSGVE